MSAAVAIVQARMRSTRLPGKVLRPLAGRPLLLHVIERARHARSLAAVVVATTDLPADAPVRALCVEHDIPFFAGSETDVLDRYYHAARLADAELVVRITADCPIVDPDVIDLVVALRRDGNLDYAASAAGATAALTGGGAFPEGLSVECFTREALGRAWREARDPFEREHVTPYLWRTGLFSAGILPFTDDRDDLRLTVDYESDLSLVSRLYEALYVEERPFSLAQAIAYLDQHPEVAALNRAHVGANRGLTPASTKRAA
jgi:spore coat polysaccharide biosynthesis protein SpsF